MTNDSILTSFLAEQDIHRIVILTDQRVNSLYPNYFQFLRSQYDVHKIVIPHGEKHKSIQQAMKIWHFLIDIKADKNILLLNFGGGMICDLGGFVASTYKRGIKFAHYPTTLLAMVDAAIGGKNGINLDYIKNCIGIIREPDYIFPADLNLLQTLSPVDLKSGLGEMIKYALIGDKHLFQQLDDIQDFTANTFTQTQIEACVSLKQRIVKQDPEDLHERHILNFGHTIGHAVESFCAAQEMPIPHGIAVAIGLRYESRLSYQFGTLTKNELIKIEQLLNRNYVVIDLKLENLKQILPYMLQDKKNEADMINFTLLEHIGKAIPDFFIEAQLLIDTLLRKPY